MYGKKRIVIQKNNQIILAGGRSWLPVGLIKYRPWLKMGIRAKVLKKVFPPIYSIHSNESEAVEEINASSKKELKSIINKKYNWIN